jgi:hypothetical protein
MLLHAVTRPSEGGEARNVIRLACRVDPEARRLFYGERWEY